MATVTRTELNQQTARVLARVHAGEDVTVTDRGRPIARVDTSVAYKPRFVLRLRLRTADGREAEI